MSLKNMRSKWIGILLFILTACSGRGCSSGVKDVPPEEQLHKYLQLAMNVTKQDDRQTLLNLTAADLHSALASASDDSFKKAYIDRKYEVLNYEIVQKNINEAEKETVVDFKLSYKVAGLGEDMARSPVTEVENRATLIYKDGQWAISKVESLQTNFTWEIGIPLDDVSTAGVTPEATPVEVQSSREENKEEGDEATPAPSPAK